MKLNFWKACLVGIICTFITPLCSASKISGYIVDNREDTIYGTFRLRNVNQTGALLISGFDELSLHSAVVFKKNGASSFETFSPEMISGFQFVYDSTIYHYKSFLIEYNSISYNDRERHKFLRLIYDGNLDLYEDIVIVEKTNGSFAGERTRYYEYFIEEQDQELTRIKIDDQTPNLRAVLRQFSIEEDFLKRISDIATIKDLPVILQEYDYWLRSE